MCEIVTGIRVRRKGDGPGHTLFCKSIWNYGLCGYNDASYIKDINQWI